MKLDADKDLQSRLACSQRDSYGHIINDPRVTQFGRFLRQYWVDELPQFYNLTRGDLKLVGIRPQPSIVWATYPAEIMDRALKQKPGLFGVQYAFDRTTSFDDNIKIMRDYLDRWEESPERTDREYLTRILKNILTGKVKSS